MKLSKSQYTLLAEMTKDFSVVIFGALIVSSIFSPNPIQWISIVIGVIFLLTLIMFSLFLKKKGNSDG